MTYEETKRPKSTANASKKVLKDMISGSNTSLVIWYIVLKHKTGVLLTWAIVATVLYALPTLPTFLTSLFI